MKKNEKSRKKTESAVGDNMRSVEKEIEKRKSRKRMLFEWK